MRAGISPTTDIEPPSSGSGTWFLLSTDGRTKRQRDRKRNKRKKETKRPRKEAMDEEEEYTFAADDKVTAFTVHAKNTARI